MEKRLEVLKMYKLFIGGKFSRTESERYYTAFSKSNRKLCNVSRGSRKDIRNAVTSARNAFDSWSGKTAYERGQILYRLAEMLEGRKEQFVNELMKSLDVGKSIALKEVHKSIDRIICYAGISDKWLQILSSVNSVQHGYFNFTIPEPMGVVGIISPDEPPLLSMISCICPAIVSGNTVVIIPSEKNPLPCLTFSEVISTSDIPAGVINIITGYKKELIEHLAGHMDVNCMLYSDTDKEQGNKIKMLCANNIKRMRITETEKDNYENYEKFENVTEVQKFIEFKTIWHTMGY